MTSSRNKRIPSVCAPLTPKVPREAYAQVVGAELAYQRRMHELTQTDVATRIGVSPSTISSVERGRMLPGIPMLCNICAAIGIDPAAVISVVNDSLN